MENETVTNFGSGDLQDDSSVISGDDLSSGSAEVVEGESITNEDLTDIIGAEFEKVDPFAEFFNPELYSDSDSFYVSEGVALTDSVFVSVMDDVTVSVVSSILYGFFLVIGFLISLKVLGERY